MQSEHRTGASSLCLPYQFHFSGECYCAHPILWLGRRDNTQLIMANWGCTVTLCSKSKARADFPGRKHVVRGEDSLPGKPQEPGSQELANIYQDAWGFSLVMSGVRVAWITACVSCRPISSSQTHKICSLWNALKIGWSQVTNDICIVCNIQRGPSIEGYWRGHQIISHFGRASENCQLWPGPAMVPQSLAHVCY